jgi:hypothetical protein
MMKLHEQQFVDYLKENIPDFGWPVAILEDGVVKTVHIGEALVWQINNKDKMTVAKTDVGEFEVSTVFFTSSFTGRHEPARHFETMIFGKEKTLTFGRWETLEEAKAGHERACTQAQNLEWNRRHP